MDLPITNILNAGLSPLPCEQLLTPSHEVSPSPKGYQNCTATGGLIHYRPTSSKSSPILNFWTQQHHTGCVLLPTLPSKPIKSGRKQKAPVLRCEKRTSVDRGLREQLPTGFHTKAFRSVKTSPFQRRRPTNREQWVLELTWPSNPWALSDSEVFSQKRFWENQKTKENNDDDHDDV